ncbi:MAG: hypothetical protein FJW27_12150 [Acidimicrobiia bacterium]|nr:hypothetical protein [Acidimicrobiia bacterium]
MRIELSRRAAGLALVGLLMVTSARSAGTGTPVARPMLEAAREGNWAAVREALEQGAPTNARFGDGSTALHWAVHWDHLEMVSALIAAKAAVNAVDDDGIGPLALACVNGTAAVVDALLKAGANPNAPRSTGETPIMTAARTGSVAAVASLLAFGADPNAKESSRGQTALMWAITQGHNEVARALIGKGANIRAATTSGFVPLLFAAQQGNVDGVKLLLEAGADVNAIAHDGSDALIIALDSGIRALYETDKPNDKHQATAFYLLDHGANVSSKTAGRMPLHSAVWTQQPEVVKALLARGADVNGRLAKPMPKVGRALGGAFRVSQTGATPFWLAAHLADLPMMRLLVERGANATLASDDGSTPLMMAVGLDNYEGWERHGIPFHGDRAAQLRQYFEAARYALEQGGDVNAKSKTGLTALHAAALTGGNDTLVHLVSKGADINAMDEKGRSPLNVAEGIFSGVFLTHPETAEAIKKLGGRRGTAEPDQL